MARNWDSVKYVTRVRPGVEDGRTGCNEFTLEESARFVHGGESTSQPCLSHTGSHIHLTFPHDQSFAQTRQYASSSALQARSPNTDHLDINSPRPSRKHSLESSPVKKILAVQQEYSDNVAFDVLPGAQVSEIDGQTETLHSLARKGRNHEIGILLQQNEDIDKQDSYGKTPLHSAVTAGQVETVKFLLQWRANPNVKDHREETALHAAARTGNTDMVEALLSCRLTDVNMEGRNKYTPLHTAASTEHKNALEICQKLLDRGAELSARALDQMTPLAVAAMKGFPDILALFFKSFKGTAGGRQSSSEFQDLLYHGDAEGSSLIHLAIDSSVIQAVQLCLEQGCSVTAVRKSDGSSPIHLACRLGALEIVKCLHEHAPAEFTQATADSDGMTPLHRAGMYNHVGVVQFLVDIGCDVNPRDCEMCTPLLLAAAHGCSAVVSLLLDSGADVSSEDEKGRTALHWAVGQEKTIEKLVKDPQVMKLQLVNQTDSTGASALHYASQGGFMRSVLLLLKHGADVGLKTEKMETPLHLAASNGWLPIVKKLMEGRQTRLMNVGNSMERTPLHLAASNGQEKVVKFLLDRGATVDRDTDGRTPLHFAAAKGCLKSVQLITASSPACINDEDNTDQDTALHLAAKNGHDQVVTHLLSRKHQLVSYNSCNQNALDIAIEAGKDNVVKVIAEHQRWRELCHRLEGGLTQLQNLVMKMPDVAEMLLSRCVEEHGDKEKDENYMVTYDFMFLQGMPDIVKDDPKKFLDCLHTMVKFKRVGCLSHPVCTAIMSIKWRNIGWKAYVTNLSFYIVFLVLMTTMTTLLSDNDSTHSEYLDIPRYIIILMSLFHLLKELFQIWDEKFKYLLKIDNWMEWFLYMTSLVYMFKSKNVRGDGAENDVTTALAASAIFIAWVIFVLYLRRFSTFGIYIIMMTNIIRTLVKIIILFIPFTIAFGIPFYLLFHRPLTTEGKSNPTGCPGKSSPTEYVFDQLPLSLFTTFMLILGEMKYPHTVFKYQPLPHPWITFVLYVIFCLCMPIIIKNLLIGLSVGDVNRILQSAKMEQHAMQVELLLELERATPRRILRRLWVPYCVEYPNRKKTWRQKLVEFGSPKRHTAGQRTYVNPAIVQLKEKVEKLAEKVNSQEDKLQTIIRLLGRLDQRLSEGTFQPRPSGLRLDATNAETSV